MVDLTNLIVFVACKLLFSYYMARIAIELPFIYTRDRFYREVSAKEMDTRKLTKVVPPILCIKID